MGRKELSAARTALSKSKGQIDKLSAQVRLLRSTATIRAERAVAKREAVRVKDRRHSEQLRAITEDRDKLSDYVQVLKRFVTDSDGCLTYNQNNDIQFEDEMAMVVDDKETLRRQLALHSNARTRASQEEPNTHMHVLSTNKKVLKTSVVRLLRNSRRRSRTKQATALEEARQGGSNKTFTASKRYDVKKQTRPVNQKLHDRTKANSARLRKKKSTDISGDSAPIQAVHVTGGTSASTYVGETAQPEVELDCEDKELIVDLLRLHSRLQAFKPDPVTGANSPYHNLYVMDLMLNASQSAVCIGLDTTISHLGLEKFVPRISRAGLQDAGVRLGIISHLHAGDLWSNSTSNTLLWDGRNKSGVTNVKLQAVCVGIPRSEAGVAATCMPPRLRGVDSDAQAKRRRLQKLAPVNISFGFSSMKSGSVEHGAEAICDKLNTVRESQEKMGEYEKAKRCALAFFARYKKEGDGVMHDHAATETKTRSLIEDKILIDLKSSDSVFAGLSDVEQRIASQLIIDYCIQHKFDNLFKAQLKGAASGVYQLLRNEGMLTPADEAIPSEERARLDEEEEDEPVTYSRTRRTRTIRTHADGSDFDVPGRRALEEATQPRWEEEEKEATLVSTSTSDGLTAPTNRRERPTTAMTFAYACHRLVGRKSADYYLSLHSEFIMWCESANTRPRDGIDLKVASQLAQGLAKQIGDRFWNAPYNSGLFFALQPVIQNFLADRDLAKKGLNQLELSSLNQLELTSH